MTQVMQIAGLIGGPADGLSVLVPMGETELVIVDPTKVYGDGKYVRGPVRRADGVPMLRTGDNHPVWEWVER